MLTTNQPTTEQTLVCECCETPLDALANDEKTGHCPFCEKMVLAVVR